MATPSRFELPISSLTGRLGKGLCGQAFYAMDIGATIQQRIQMTTTLQPADRSSVDRDEAIARARQFYEEEILPKYGKSHKGYFVVIDGLSLDYEIGRSGWDSEAAHRFDERCPDAISLSFPIGRDGFSLGRYYSP